MIKLKKEALRFFGFMFLFAGVAFITQPDNFAHCKSPYWNRPRRKGK